MNIIITIIVIFALFWVWIAYEFYKAPLVDDNYNIVEEDINLDECNDEEI